MTLSKLPSRPAYTLIELMVVVGLIVLLATLTVAVANSSLVDSYKIVGGADRLSGWLLTAKQRALRDKTPVGVRFIRDADNPNFIRQAQLVEMPTLYAPNAQDPADLNNLPSYAPFVAIRYTNPPPVPPPGPPYPNDLIQESISSEAGVYLYWPPNGPPNTRYPTLTPGIDLQIGDLLRIGELNTTHRISNITSVTAPSWFLFSVPPPDPNTPNAAKLYKLTLAISTVNVTGTPTQPFYPASPPYPTNLLPANSLVPPVVGVVPNAMYPTGYPPIGGANFFKSTYFGLFRSSRPILGEPLLQLPANMAVDVTLGQTTTPGERALSQNIPGMYSLNPNTPIEVMFNPNGTVLFGDAGNITFWLRDTRNSGGLNPLLMNSVLPNNDVFVDRKRLMDAGEHVIVSVYTKTGAIATYPIFPPDQSGRYDGRPLNDPSGLGDGGMNGPYKYALKATNTGL